MAFYSVILKFDTLFSHLFHDHAEITRRTIREAGRLLEAGVTPGFSRLKHPANEMAKPPKTLTEKQKIFCREYILDWNATRAAKVAGYSEETAQQIGFENLSKPVIQAHIKEIQKDMEKAAGISRLMILNEHKKIAFSSIAHLHNTWVSRKDFETLSEDQKACIMEITTQTRIEKDYSVNPEGDVMQVDYVKIKLYSKQASLDSLSKMLGYNEPDKVEHILPEKQVMIIGGKPIEF